MRKPAFAFVDYIDTDQLCIHTISKRYGPCLNLNAGQV